MSLDPAIIEYCRIGYCRIGVFKSNFPTILDGFKKIDQGSYEVTRRELELGDTPDTVTGWYPVTYSESDIEMMIATKAARQTLSVAGSYVALDAVGLTQDIVKEGDQVYHSELGYYTVETVEEVMRGDSFEFRDCDLAKLPFATVTISDTTPTVEDARYRTKDYLDTYVDSDNLNSHSFLACYDKPDYPFKKMILDKDIEIIFAIGKPDTTPLLGHSQTPYGYEEHVPIHVLTLDTELTWLAEAELRRILEAHPKGSQRSLTRTGDRDVRLGATLLYETEFTLNYRRDTT